MKLSELASFIKSANAGAMLLTFDIGFADAATFQRVLDSGALNTEVIRNLYGTAEERIRIYAYAPAATIKITIPRPSMSGGIDERDFDGVQQFAPLLDVDVNLESEAESTPQDAHARPSRSNVRI